MLLWKLMLASFGRNSFGVIHCGRDAVLCDDVLQILKTVSRDNQIVTSKHTYQQAHQFALW